LINAQRARVRSNAGPSNPPTIALKMAVRAFVNMSGITDTHRADHAFMARATTK